MIFDRPGVNFQDLWVCFIEKLAHRTFQCSCDRLTIHHLDRSRNLDECEIQPSWHMISLTAIVSRMHDWMMTECLNLTRRWFMGSDLNRSELIQVVRLLLCFK
jgi:hypothetical protein